MAIGLLVQCKISNDDEYLGVVRKWEDHIRQTPGAVRVDCYADRESGTVYFDEEWADGDALINHFAQMQKKGLSDEINSVQNIEGIFLLTPTDHPGVNALLDQVGATRMERLATFRR